MFRTMLVLAIALRAATATAAEKQPFTVDDVYRLEQITDFKISPLGDEAVYVRHFYDVNLPTRHTVLWRIDGKTGHRAPLEPGEPDGRMPVYSPNGKWLALISDRARSWETSPEIAKLVPPYSERPGLLWLLPRDGSDEVFKPQSPETSLLMHDGFYGRIAFSSDSRSFVYSSSSREGDNLYSDRVDHEGQGEGYEGYQPTILEQQWTPDRKEEAGFDAFHLAHFLNRDQAFNVGPRFWYGDPQYTPDGKSVIAHANRTEDQESVRYSINKNYDLWQFPTRLRDTRRAPPPKQLTTNPGPDVSPRISPDGKHALYLSVPRKGPHMDVFNLCVLPLDAEKPEPRVIVNAHEAERDADGTPPFQPTFPLRDDCWIDAEHVRVTGVRGMKTETVVFNIAGPDAPISASAKPEPEPQANPHFKKPDANPWLADRYHGPQEIVRWKSFDGLEIDGVLTLPPPELKQFSKPYAVIVNPHGGPHGANSLGFNLNAQVMAAAGYAVFQPNYRGSYGYGRKFLDAARFDMGGSDMQDILTGVDQLIADGVVDEKRQYIFGSSYGGYSTCRLVTMTDRFRAAVAQNAVTDLHAMWRLSDIQSWTEWEFGGKPWETIERDGKQIDVAAEMIDRSPTTHAHKVKTPTLLLHADHDRRVPLPMGQMFYRLLRENGVETDLVIYRDERHQLQQVKHQADALQRTLDWFAGHAE